MKQCSACTREFPDHLVSDMAIGEPGRQLEYRTVCPMCALEIGNEIHGEKRLGFYGAKAQAMLEEARTYAANKARDALLAVLKPDWRIGLTCKPRLRTHELYYEQATVRDVHPSGTGGYHDKDGVLRIELASGRMLLVPAGDWITA